ncbi:MAG: hypothetical protein R2837_12470 [Aliarcobacter sp.]
MRKVKNIIVFATLFTIISCQEDKSIEKFIEMQHTIDSLRLVNSELETKISKSIIEKDSLLEVVKKNKKKSSSSNIPNNKVNTNKSKYYSEQEAVSYVEDYYNFYKADNRARNIRVRRLENNKFNVYLEENTKNLISGKFNNDYWGSRYYVLTILNNGKYEMNIDFHH